MQTEKQQFELNAIRLFQQAGGLVLNYTLTPGADPPDVLASHGRYRVGIEVRRLFTDEESKGGSPERRRLSISQAVVDRATELHSAISDKQYIIHVHFNKNITLYDNRIAPISEVIVAHVVRTPIQVGQPIYLRSEELWGSDWPEEVLYIGIGLLEGDGIPFWGLSDSNWVGKTSPEIIQKGLDRKKGRFEAFCDSVDEGWLLMLCDGSVGPSLLELHSEIKHEKFSSSFNRAFVMDFSGKKYAEIELDR